MKLYNQAYQFMFGSLIHWLNLGDDCISIVSGSQNVQAQDITCGPGHGIRS